MLEQFTWMDFIMMILISVTIYYTFIVAVYYRNNVMRFFKGRGKAELAYGYDEDVVDTFSGFDELEETVEDIRHKILEKAGKEASKTELLEQIRERLANYDGLRRPAYRIALTNFIIQNAESICGITFSEEELDEEWDSLSH